MLPALTKLARRHHLYILGSVLKANARREVFNSAVLLDPGAGPTRVYRKIHFFGPMLETNFSHRAARRRSFTRRLGRSLWQYATT
jgi:predicted amidohydrolase